MAGILKADGWRKNVEEAEEGRLATLNAYRLFQRTRNLTMLLLLRILHGRS
jgi:hypothetical protein